MNNIPIWAKMTALLSSTMLVATVVRPAKLWENNDIRCIPDKPFVAVSKQTNCFRGFRFVFVTTAGKEIPACIEGYQSSIREASASWGETAGIVREGTAKVDEYVAVYISVVFEEDCELNKLVIIGPDSYKVEIDLDRFWTTEHKFRKGEYYGMSFYL